MDQRPTPWSLDIIQLLKGYGTISWKVFTALIAAIEELQTKIKDDVLVYTVIEDC